MSLGHHFLTGYESSGTLARVPLAGGAPREVLESVQSADWSPDGKSLAVCRVVGNRSRLEYPIGKVLYEAASWVSGVRVSPDGRLLAFFDHPQRGNNDGYVKIVDSDGKLRLKGSFGRGRIALAWSPRGDEIWSSGIQATSIGGKMRAVWTSPSADIQDIARDGRVLLVETTGRREIVGFSGPDATPRNLTALNWSFPTDISAAGDTVLFYE